jgi:hypothetical protein
MLNTLKILKCQLDDILPVVSYLVLDEIVDGRLRLDVGVVVARPSPGRALAGGGKGGSVKAVSGGGC